MARQGYGGAHNERRELHPLMAEILGRPSHRPGHRGPAVRQQPGPRWPPACARRPTSSARASRKATRTSWSPARKRSGLRATQLDDEDHAAPALV